MSTFLTTEDISIEKLRRTLEHINLMLHMTTDQSSADVEDGDGALSRLTDMNGPQSSTAGV